MHKLKVWEMGVASGQTCVRLAPHLFEAERHGEHTDSNDAVHHIHNQAPVRRRHFKLLCDASYEKTKFFTKVNHKAGAAAL